MVSLTSVAQSNVIESLTFTLQSSIKQVYSNKRQRGSIDLEKSMSQYILSTIKLQKVQQDITRILMAVPRII